MFRKIRNYLVIVGIDRINYVDSAMKKLFLSILLLLILLVGSVFLLPLVLSSDTAREQFSERMSTISGMEIALDGPVSFSVFPDLGLVAKNVKLSSPGDDFSVSILKVVSGVSLSSVLSGKLEITGFSLSQPEIIIDQSRQQHQPADGKQKSGDNNDLFASAVELFEKLSLNRFEVSNGRLILRSADGVEDVVSNINILLLAPSLDGEIKLDFDTLKGGRQITSTVSLAALRPILKRQPSLIEIALKIIPPPHPALADLSVRGKILLDEDGSYQLIDGALVSLEQPLRLDALYRPGKRPYVNLKIAAENIDFGTVEKISSGSQDTDGGSSGNNVLSNDVYLRPLLDVDADVNIVIDHFSMDGAEIRQINLQAALKDGSLDVNLGNAEIANGSIAAQATARLDDQNPSVQGNFSAVSLGIGRLAKLANTKPPLTGVLGLNIGYAFQGLDAKSIKESFNFAGTVSLSDGAVIIPALGELGLGPSAARISALNITANIQHAQKPVDIKAGMNWNGEAIRLNGLVTPHGFFKNGSGPITLSIDSNRFVADYSGNASIFGVLNGDAKLSTKSLSGLLAWLGRSKNEELKGFSYSGKVKLDSNRFAFEQARISLNDINAKGSGSIGLKGKPSINTVLAFDALDIAALTGGKTKASAASNDSVGQSGNVPIDLSALKGFDANIKLSALKIGYGKVSAGPVQTTLAVKNGIARMKLPQTAFYGGSILADIVADGSGSVAAVNVDTQLTRIDALPLFSDAADFKRIEGKLYAKISIHGSGATTRQFAKSLAGKSSARFADGAIRGVDIAKVYNNLTTILTGGFKENSSDKTTFTALGLSFDIDKGVATTSDVKLQGPLVRMNGAGNVDLGEETINMRLNPRVVASVSGQGGDYDVSGLGIPVVVKGPLSKPRVYPDISELAKNPQAALASLSKLGLKIKGLDLKSLGKGKLDVAKIAAEKLGLDKLNQIAGKGTAEKVGKVVGGLLAGKNSDENTSTENIVGALVNQLIKPDASGAEAVNTDQPADAVLQQEEDVVPNVTGRIPIPTPKPGRKSAVVAAPKTVEQLAIEKIAPKIKLPVDDAVKKEGLKMLFDNILKKP